MTRMLIAALALVAAAGALAQTAFPTRPVTLIVGFAPGGGTDIMARQLGQKLSESLGQQVIGAYGAHARGGVGQLERAGDDPHPAGHQPRDKPHPLLHQPSVSGAAEAALSQI